MTTTPILALDELASGQAIPEVTVNEWARWLEFFAAGGGIVDRDDTAPPGSPVDGEAYLVATGGTGAWSGHDGEIALYISTAWAFKEPVEGMVLYVKDEDLRIVYDGAAWVASSTTGGGVEVLDDLTDVDAAAPDDGDVLTWDDGAGEWVPAPVSAALREVPVFNFSADGEARFYADEAMTLTQQATSGTGSVAYEKSTNAAPSTFSGTSSPVTLEAGAWLKVTASSVTDIYAVALTRTA